MEYYYEQHIICDWCGYSTRGEIVDITVICNCCKRILLDDISKLA